ncbi:MAG: HEAT repeat domain-containing protein [Methanoregulaceae archaeon]|nr:HEAT repeat domain-containing protein [Methanoregulaceae archaeon]
MAHIACPDSTRSAPAGNALTRGIPPVPQKGVACHHHILYRYVGISIGWRRTMSLTEVYQMKDAGDVTGLLTALDNRDEYVRRAAVVALSGFPGQQVSEVLERLQFDDPVALVRTAASLAYARVTASLHQKEGR